MLFKKIFPVPQKFFKSTWILLLILFFFGILFSSVSIVNHYNFRTAGWDLGLFNNAIYDYAHFHWNDCSLLLPNFNIRNTLGDHFSLLPIFISPFYWIFGSYTMLIFQIIGILWGGVGIYKLILETSKNQTLSLLAVVHFFSIWGIYSALGFDYHDNVLAAMFVPWFLFYVRIEKWWYAAIYFFLVLVSKENMALWMAFICIGLIFIYYKDRKKLKYIIPGAFISVSFFILLIKIIIPSISSSEGYIHFDFSALGNNMTDALSTIIKHPEYTFNLLFENHLGDPQYNGIKTELFYVILMSGGFALIFKPQYLIMLIPIFAQKLFNDLYTRWGINAQYSIELVPVITVALFVWITDKNFKRKNLLAAFFILLTMCTTISVLDSRKSLWYSPSQERFYQKQHYFRNFNVNDVYAALNKIPDDADLSAQSALVPHVCFRKEIYHYPYVRDAQYIALLTADENIYPFSTKEEYDKNIQDLIKSGSWAVYFQNSAVLILQRIK